MGETDRDRSEQSIESLAEPKPKFWTSFRRGVRSQPHADSEQVEQPTSKSGIGRLLRETREARHITLDEAENVTRIRSKYLAALESGAYQELPTPGHVYGFLRTYALFLGLDWQEIEAMYRKEHPVRNFDPGIFHPENIALFPRRPLLRAELVLILVVLFVVLVIGGWAYWQYGRSLFDRVLAPAPTQTPTIAAGQVSATATPTATQTRQTVVTPTSTPTASPATPTPQRPTPTLAQPTATATHTILPTATPTVAPTSTSLPATAVADKVTLMIKVIERAWIQVTLDGQVQPGKILEAGTEQTWEARQSIYFICGNAGGVEVTVNGQALGLLGERAQVVEKTWTPSGEATPTPTPEWTATAVPTPTPKE